MRSAQGFKVPQAASMLVFSELEIRRLSPRSFSTSPNRGRHSAAPLGIRREIGAPITDPNAVCDKPTLAQFSGKMVSQVSP